MDAAVVALSHLIVAIKEWDEKILAENGSERINCIFTLDYGNKLSVAINHAMKKIHTSLH